MIDETLKQILECERRQPIEILPARLDTLFHALAQASDMPEAYAIEDEIWALWTDHEEPALRARMNQAIAAIASREYDDAGTLINAIVCDAPLWPEAWNKRATLHFLIGDDQASARDIERTLSMEPRHFGAMSGFGQICLRNGRPDAALATFETALRIHPTLSTVRIAVEELRRPSSPIIH